MGKKKYFSLFTLGIIIPVSTILIASCSSLNNSNITLPSDTPSENPSNNSQNQNTKIVSTIKSSQIGWENKTKIDIYEEYKSSISFLNINNPSNNLNDFVFQNLSIFIKGNVNLIKNNTSLDAKLSNWNKEDNNISSLTLSLTIKANNWYLNNVIQKNDLVQKIEITNLKAIPNWIDSSGGFIDNSNKLHASKYAKVLRSLNLNYLVPLAKLDNNILNKELHKVVEFTNLQLEILSGSSTREGKLILNLKGLYEINSANKIDINTRIIVEGFFKVSNNLDLSIQDFKLNFTNWFTNNKPIFEDNAGAIVSINKNDWLNKYIDNFNVYENSSNWTMQEFLTYGFVFKTFTASLTNDSKKIKFVFDGSYVNKKYDGQNWNEEMIIKWQQSNLNINSATLDVPRLDDVQKWLIGNIEVDKNKLKKHYPSYFKGIESLSESINNSTYYSFENYLSEKSKIIMNNIGTYYFPKEPITINLNKDVIANDFTNFLSFSLFLQVGYDYKFNFIKNFSFNKQLDKDLVNVLPKNNLVTLQPSNADKNNWFEYIFKYLKRKHKNTLDNFINDINSSSSITIIEENLSQVILQTINNKSLINSGNWPHESESVKKNFEIISKHVIPKIFNKELKLVINDRKYPPKIEEGSFNYESRLYNNTKDFSNAFYLEDVRYVFPNKPLIITLTKIQSTINIEFQGETVITFANGEFHNYTTSFVMVMLKNEWK